MTEEVAVVCVASHHAIVGSSPRCRACAELREPSQVNESLCQSGLERERKLRSILCCCNIQAATDQVPRRLERGAVRFLPPQAPKVVVLGAEDRKEASRSTHLV